VVKPSIQRAFLAGVFVVLAGEASADEKRVALIVGSDAYRGLAPLNNMVVGAN
jgi:hypothetical protein